MTPPAGRRVGSVARLVVGGAVVVGARVVVVGAAVVVVGAALVSGCGAVAPAGPRPCAGSRQALTSGRQS